MTKDAFEQALAAFGAKPHTTGLRYFATAITASGAHVQGHGNTEEEARSEALRLVVQTPGKRNP